MPLVLQFIQPHLWRSILWGIFTMQILCKASDTVCDVRCAICGQGFLVYWTRSCAEDRTTDISELLCAHHLHGASGSAAHPSREFSLSVAPKAGYMETLGAYA